MERYLKPGMNVVDIGANIGSHAILAADLVSPGGKVLAVEADPSTFGILSENLSANRIANVQAFQKCVSDRVGVSTFNVNENSARSSMVRPGANVISVPTDKLDNLIPRDLSIDLLKIDVEGADYLVLRGAAETLATRPPRIIAVETSANQPEIVSLLSDFDYRLCSFDPATGSFSEVAELQFNTFAIHPSASVTVLRSGA